jgi:hypothetical protein
MSYCAILQAHFGGKQMSIVQQLQIECISQSTSITQLLRKALIVANKLKANDFKNWIESELNGYNTINLDELPSYRRFNGTPQVYNPYKGWEPILFESSTAANNLSSNGTHQPISEIEFMIDNSKSDGRFEFKYPPEIEQYLMKAIGVRLQPVLLVSGASVKRVIESVRTIILNWALKLEEDGILGTDISFTYAEVKKAEHANYIVNNFYGDVNNSQIQQATKKSSQSQDNESNL